MNALRKLSVALTLLGLIALAGAGLSPVGTWKGRIVAVATKGKATPADSQQIARMRTVVAEIVIKADKTFTSRASGTGRPAHIEKGTWKLAGHTLTLTTMIKSRANPGRTESLTMSKDGKTMTLTSTMRSIFAKAVFTKS